MNYTQIHCQEALERYGNTSCPCNHGLSQEAYDYCIHDDGGNDDYSIHDDGGNDFEPEDMCNVFDYSSPQKKPMAEKEQGYTTISQL